MRARQLLFCGAVVACLAVAMGVEAESGRRSSVLLETVSRLRSRSKASPHVPRSRAMKAAMVDAAAVAPPAAEAPAAEAMAAPVATADMNAPDEGQYRFAAQGAEAEAQAGTKAGMTVNLKDLAKSDCKICIYVMERIKQGFQYMLPSICVEIWSKVGDQAAYGKCHNVLAALSVWGHNVRHWFQFGCYKSETYGAMSLVKPCPSHVICSQIADLEKKHFCKPEEPYKVE